MTRFTRCLRAAGCCSAMALALLTSPASADTQWKIGSSAAAASTAVHRTTVAGKVFDRSRPHLPPDTLAGLSHHRLVHAAPEPVSLVLAMEPSEPMDTPAVQASRLNELTVSVVAVPQAAATGLVMLAALWLRRVLRARHSLDAL